jgi:diguanylate cyclase (GGDEF)-like protein/PAS domain S-box-containing protein
MQTINSVHGPATVLIVEDRSAMRIVLGEFVRSAFPGCAVYEAADGAEAISMFAGHKPQLVLMDLGLPDANGIDLTRRFKTEAPETEVIAVSYQSSDAHVTHALAAGAAGYVTKDRLLSDLIPLISRCLEPRAARRVCPETGFTGLAAAIEDTNKTNERQTSQIGRPGEHFRAQDADARLAAIVESTSDAIVNQGLDGTIQTWNAAAERLFGWTAPEAIGQSIAILVPPERRAEMRPLVERAIAGEAVGTVESVHLRKDGSRVETTLALSPVRNRRNAITGVSLIIRDIGEHKRAEREINRLVTVVRQAQASVVITDLAARIVYVNPFFEKITGYSRAEVLGKNPRILSSGQQNAEFYRALWSTLTAGGVWSGEFVNRRKDGSLYHEEAVIFPIRDDTGATTNYAAVKRDVTELRKTQEQLSATLRKLEGILGTLQEVVYSCDAGSFEARYVSPAAETISGYAPAAFSEDPTLWFKLVHPDDRERVAAALARLREDGKVEVEYRIVRPEGDTRTVRNTAQIVHDEHGRPERIDGVVTDVTEQRRAQERIAYLSQYDTLTGLPNRTLFRDRLELAVAHARRRDETLGVLLVNLDRFRKVNESLGHDAGDDLLRQVASRLKSSLREVDTIARLDGDNYAVLVEGIRSSADAGAVAEKLIQSLEDPFNVRDQETFVTASVGVAVCSDGQCSPEPLLEQAAAALSRAKHEGSGGYQLYEKGLAVPRGEHIVLEARLRHALGNGELSVHYQPKVDLRTGAITGAEALLRWESPALGLVSPARFIPLAEETGLIVPISEWILSRACAQARAWHCAGFPIGVAVNLSPRQFRQKNLLDVVCDALEKTGLAPESLELEITETMTLARPEHAASIVNRLRGLGVRIALDDFGTGYSSLSHLRRFPLNTVKIDRSFVQDADSDPSSAAIVRATIALAHSLKLRVVAEGIETDAQRDFLAAAGCDEYQGFLFSRPLPAAEFRTLLELHYRGAAAHPPVDLSIPR